MQNLVTRVQRVTVHPNGALVVRSGVATESQVEVLGLPLLFSSDSLRVRTGRGAVMDLRELARLVHDGTDAPRPTDELARQGVLVEMLALREQGLTSIAAALEGVHPADITALADLEVPGLPSIPGWLAVQQDIAERLRLLDEERARIRTELKAAQRQLENLRMLTRTDPRPPRFTRGIAFLLAGASGEVPVEIEYFVDAARWVPTYALHLDGTRAALSVRALVAQASGEDWTDAQLAFSTSDLTRDATLPELQSWRMGRAQPPPRPAFRPLPDDLHTLFRDYDNAKQGRTPTGRAEPAKPAEPPPPPPPPPASGSGVMAVMLDELAEGGEEPEEEEATAGVFERPRMAKEEAPRPQRAMPSAPPAMAQAAPMAKRKALGGFGGGGAPGSAYPVVKRPPAAPPPRLRYTYLRLAGPDDPGRGTLQPLDVLGHLQQLVDTHRPDDTEALTRAIDALQQAARALRHAPMPPGTVPLDSCHFHHVYEAPGRHAIPSDGTFHGVAVKKDEGPAALEHRSVPRASLDVFRYAVLQPTTVPYPVGPMHVYQDGSYRVTSTLPAQSHTQSIELNLGIDPDVRVLERVVHVNQEEKGLVGQTSRVEHKVRVQVLSTSGAPVKLVLYDRLPTTQENEKDIQVSLVSATPEPVKKDRWLDGTQLRGGLVWTVPLEPGAKKDVGWHYAITLPARSELVGGNRRE